MGELRHRQLTDQLTGCQVGELCHCLRIFGWEPADSAPLREGLAYLVEKQRARDGSWPTRGGDDQPYTK